MSNPLEHQPLRQNYDLSEVNGLLLTSGDQLDVSEVTLANPVFSDKDAPGNEFREPKSLVVTVAREGTASRRAIIKQSAVAGFFLA
jgi:hypothetical protein